MAAGDVDRDVGVAAFRVLQESLTNVARHAAASSVFRAAAVRDPKAPRIVVKRLRFSTNADRFTVKRSRFSMNSDRFMVNQSQFSKNSIRFMVNQSRFFVNASRFTANRRAFTRNPRPRPGGGDVPRGVVGSRGEIMSRMTTTLDEEGRLVLP